MLQHLSRKIYISFQKLRSFIPNCCKFVTAKNVENWSMLGKDIDNRQSCIFFYDST